MINVMYIGFSYEMIKGVLSKQANWRYCLKMIHKKNILMFIMLAVFIFQCSDNNLPDDGTVKIIHNESSIWGDSPQISLELVNTIGGLDEDDDNDIFFNPFDVVLDASDNLYVLDTGHHRIQKYGPDRKYLSTIGREGDGPGELKGPVHLNIVNNELVVNSSREQKVHYFTLDGKYISTTRVIRNTGLFIPLGSGKMAISDQGRARRPEPDNLMIDILDNDGGFINAFMTPKDYGNNFQGTGNTFFMTSDPQENIYVTFKFQNRIEKYNLNGEMLMQISRDKPYSPFVDNIENGREIIERIDGSGEFFYSRAQYSWDIKIDPKNRIWVLSEKRQMTKEQAINIDYSDLYVFEIYNPAGQLLGEIDVEGFSQWGSFRIFDDKLFLIDTQNEMDVKEFRIVEK